MSTHKHKSGLELKPDQKFRAFLEAAPDAIVVVNHLALIIMVNELTEKIFGYSREELIGQKVEILVPEKIRESHVKYRDGYIANPHTRPMGEGRELLGRRKDGSEFPVEISLSPIQTEDEQLVISIIRDIGPRKQLEAKFRGLLESAPDGIIVVDTKGKISIINSQTEKLFGYTKDELIGQPIEILVPDEVKKAHVNYRDSYIANPHTRPMGAGRLLSGRRKDNSIFPVEISLSPLETEQGLLITSIVRDITDRRNAENEIKATLAEKEALLSEKEALLKEIHHRVKNNLQVTSSLLRLQSGYIQDEHVRGLFAESQNRIRSMALVHEKLYKSSDLSRINFFEYAENLTQLLFRSFGVNQNQIQYKISGYDVFLSIENAVPCGLILNELVSNCLKHAFPDKRAGEITVNISEINGTITIIISDNGVGFPKDFDFDKTDTLGLKLVNTLVKQLNANIEIDTKKGTEFKILLKRSEQGEVK